jgi:beta-glucosidase
VSRLALAFACSFLLICSSASAAGRCGAHPWCDASLTPETRASLLLGALTQQEKVGLLAGDELFGVAGGADRHTGAENGVPRVGLPPVYYSDGPVGPRQGKATSLPSPMSVAASFDPSVAQRHGAVVGDEAKKKGNDVVFAPTVNIMRTPLGGRTFESFGEETLTHQKMGVAWLKGLQAQGVIGNVKHFALNNQEGKGSPVSSSVPIGITEGNRMTVNVVVDERTMREVYLPHFEAAVKEAGVGSVMCSYNRVAGQYACESEELLSRILRRDWGFKGYVLADYLASHGPQSSLNNGLDFEPWPGIAYGPLPVNALLASGRVSAATLDERIRNVLRTLFAGGFFDRDAYRNDDGQIDAPAHAREAADLEASGITLLKNDGGVLPVTAGRKVAVIGSDAAKFKSGGGSSNVAPSSVTTALDGIRARFGADRVVYDDGSDAERAVSVAKAADVAVVVAADVSTEGADRPCLGLNCGANDQLDRDALIAAVAAAQPKTVAVLMTGGPVLTPWRDAVAGLVEAWYPGQEGGTAIARVLAGDVDPGGRLPVTFPKSEADLPTAGDPEKYPGTTETVKYKEGVLVGYRWFDAQKLEPAYAFGHGLSYTSFAMRDLRAAPAAGKPTPMTTPQYDVSVAVKNTGSRPGIAVPQLYLTKPAPAGIVQPPRQLAAFGKVALKPGETKRVTLTLTDRSFSFWDANEHAWRIQPGCYGVHVGSSSRDLPLTGALAQGGASCPGLLASASSSSSKCKPASKKVRARWRKRGTNERGTSCGVVRLLRAASARSVAYRLGAPARVSLTVKRGRKVVHRVTGRDAVAGKTYRVTVPARKVRRRGAYTVALRAVPRIGKPVTLKVTARRR